MPGWSSNVHQCASIHSHGIHMIAMMFGFPWGDDQDDHGPFIPWNLPPAEANGKRRPRRGTMWTRSHSFQGGWGKPQLGDSRTVFWFPPWHFESVSNWFDFVQLMLPTSLIKVSISCSLGKSGAKSSTNRWRGSPEWFRDLPTLGRSKSRSTPVSPLVSNYTKWQEWLKIS